MRNFRMHYICERTFGKLHKEVNKFLDRTDVNVKDIKYTDEGDNVTAFIHYYNTKK